MSARPAVALLGDLNLDLSFPVGTLPPPGGEVHGEAELALGGSAALTARWLAALGCEVRLAAAVGDDPLGDWLLSALARDGVPTEGVQRGSGLPTGLCLALVLPGGERTLLAAPGACRKLRWDRIPGSWLDGADWLHLSGYAWAGEGEREAAERAVLAARRRGIPRSLDPGAAAPSLSGLDLSVFDLVLPNRREAIVLSGEEGPREGARALRRGGTRWVAVKLDAEGCFIAGPSGEAEVPAYPVPAGNTTGAGDAFNAGAIAGILSGWGLEEAGCLGNLLGAAAARGGAGAPLPTLSELARLLDSRPEGATLGPWLAPRWRRRDG